MNLRSDNWGKSLSARLRSAPLLPYAVSIASVLVAASARLALVPVLGDHHPYTFFFAAIALTSWFAGFWPSVVAIILAYCLADWFFVTPHFKFDFGNYRAKDFVGLAGFLCSGLAIAFTSRALHSARRRAEARQNELAREILEREKLAGQLKEANEKLEAHAVLLEQSVQERTAHLTATIHSLEAVCYHLAHDLRAPLRAMNGYTGVLLAASSEKLNERELGHLQRIQASADRMDTLLLCLMEYGRIGHQQFVWQTVDIEEELRSVWKDLAELVESSRAEFVIQTPLPRVWGSVALVRQILLQLVSNALMFVAPGVSPRITICADARASATRFWVNDNGVGIAPEYHHKIFRIFERLHSGNEFKGTGIGLAIVAKAVERMGGRVGLESDVGQGSKFWVELLLPPMVDSGNDLTASSGRRVMVNNASAVSL